MADTPRAPGDRRLMGLFLLCMVLLIGGIVAVMLALPAESGPLTPTARSGDLSFGGRVGAHGDLVYYAPAEGGLVMRDVHTGRQTAVCDGDCRSLNVGATWVTFVRDGDVVRLPLGNAVEPQMLAAGKRCREVSVNGPWIYFTDGDGALWKMREDGAAPVLVSDAAPIDFFTVDNRRVVALCEGAVWQMLTDGTARTPVVGPGVEKFLYTDDCLWYYADGRLQRVWSLAGGRKEGDLPIPAVTSPVFQFETAQDGARLYTADESGITEHLLPSLMQTAGRTLHLSDAADVQALYLAGHTLYFIDRDGELQSLDLDEAEQAAENR